jgi:L-threonylcarbamoyladenylate synthase
MAEDNPRYETIVRRNDGAAIDEAAELIAAGFPVAIPTETVYGLAARADQGDAVARIYAAKGRPAFNPLIVHIGSLEQAETLAVFDQTARALAQRFWPGPLTIILPLKADAPIAALATAGLATIALRMPAHPAMRAVLQATGLPLAAPSANASGTISPTRAEHVMRSLGGRIPMIIDAGPTALGLESTIVAVADGTVTVLRPGPLAPDSWHDIAATRDDQPELDRITAPGRLASHYAPSKPLRLNAGQAHLSEWLIGFGDAGGDANLSPAGDLSEAAARLFDLLHEADTQDRAAIAIAPIPEIGLGVAINDRLRRAAAPRTGP